MSKKQQMVNELTEKLKTAGITPAKSMQGHEPYYESPVHNYWKLYPEGYCNQFGSVEERLSLFTEQNLSDILEHGDILKGATVSEQLECWRGQGLLKSEPFVFNDPREHMPVLRLSSDAYLSWFRSYGFQVSYDAYANGARCGSDTDLGLTNRIVEIYREANEDTGVALDGVFCKLMYLSYPLEAAGGFKVFGKLLRDNSEVVDEFFDATDDSVMRKDLDKSLNINELCLRLGSGVFRADSVVSSQLVLVDKQNAAGSKAFATLLLHEAGVELRWIAPEGPRYLCAAIPKWDREYFIDTVQACGWEGCRGYLVSKQDWYRSCWYHLSIALMVLAGITVSHLWSAPMVRSNFMTFDERVSAQANYVCGRNGLGSIITGLCKQYPTLKEELAGIKEG